MMTFASHVDFSQTKSSSIWCCAFAPKWAPAAMRMAGKFIVLKLLTLFTVLAQECKKFRAINRARRLPSIKIQFFAEKKNFSRSRGAKLPPQAFDVRLNALQVGISPLGIL